MPFVEGDDLHPKANVEKMSSGQPLNDTDREPWLDLIRKTAIRKVGEQQQHQAEKGCSRGVVISCSALKKYYRDILRGKQRQTDSDISGSPLHSNDIEGAHPSPDVVVPTYFIFIDGTRELLMERMEKRPGHFMKASMLDSQLNTLESPVGEEGVILISQNDSTNEQVRKVKEGLGRIGGFRFSGLC
jgi:gluconokinase